MRRAIMTTYYQNELVSKTVIANFFARILKWIKITKTAKRTKTRFETHRRSNANDDIYVIFFNLFRRYIAMMKNFVNNIRAIVDTRSFRLRNAINNCLKWIDFFCVCKHKVKKIIFWFLWKRWKWKLRRRQIECWWKQFFWWCEWKWEWDCFCEEFAEKKNAMTKIVDEKSKKSKSKNDWNEFFNF